jgi:hypothetical protein
MAEVKSRQNLGRLGAIALGPTIALIYGALSLANLSDYLVQVSACNTDYAIVYELKQSLINPVVRLINNCLAFSGRVAHSMWPRVQAKRECPAMSPGQGLFLWETVLVDFVGGTVFWCLVGNALCLLLCKLRRNKAARLEGRAE